MKGGSCKGRGLRKSISVNNEILDTTKLSLEECEQVCEVISKTINETVIPEDQAQKIGNYKTKLKDQVEFILNVVRFR